MNQLNKIFAVGALFFASTAAQAGLIEYNMPYVSNYSSTDAIVNWFSTDPISDDIESFTLNMRWVDQGWGNRKGRIYYRSGDSGWTNLGVLAGHRWSFVNRTVSSSVFDFDPGPLQFGYRVGGGGGHDLFDC